jgi:hypothetical protein
MCKKNTGDLYWFGPKNALRSVGEVKVVLSCTKMLVVGVTKRVREGGAPKSQGVSGVCVCVTLLVPSQGPRELSVRLSCVCLVERSLHAPFIVSRRCRVTKYWYVA